MRSISHRNLPQLFLKAREELMRHFRPILNHFGLTEQQWRILRTLSEQDRLEPWEICEICQILSPSLAGVLSRMDDMGLVIRQRVPEDQRRVIVQLSARGEKIVVAISPLVEAQYKLIEKALGRELLADLYDVLDRVFVEPRPPIARVELPEAGASAAAPARAKAGTKPRKKPS